MVQKASFMDPSDIFEAFKVVSKRFEEDWWDKKGLEGGIRG